MYPDRSYISSTRLFMENLFRVCGLVSVVKYIVNSSLYSAWFSSVMLVFSSSLLSGSGGGNPRSRTKIGLKKSGFYIALLLNL